jgi:hypothetical protein
MSAWLLDRFFGKRIACETRRYLAAVAGASIQASRARASALLRSFSERPGPHVFLGETVWGAPVRVPLSEVISKAGLMTGGSGSGKTMTALLIIAALLESSEIFPAGFAMVDGAKSDLFTGALFLVQRRLEELSRRDPAAASKLRHRVRIIDFAAPNVVTPFNIPARWPMPIRTHSRHTRPLLLNLVPDSDALKLAAAPLKTLVQIFSTPGLDLSVVDLIESLDDDAVLDRVVNRCRNNALVGILRRQMATVLKSTRAALRRRMEVLVSSKSVSRILAGRTAPDFRRFQDDGYLLLVNCAGPNISSSLTRFLNTLTMSYFCRSIYARRRPETRFMVFADEAQDLLASAIMSDHLSDAGRLSRRYGTHFCLITQNLSAAFRMRVCYGSFIPMSAGPGRDAAIRPTAHS